MPKYKLPPEKKGDDKKSEAPISGAGPSEYQRRITVPVNQEILDAVQTGQMVEVTLMAEVIGTRSNESPDYSDRSVELKIGSVEIYPESEDDEDAGMRAGYEDA